MVRAIAFLAILIAFGIGAASPVAAQAPLDSFFTYQGRLKDAGELVTGTVNMQFYLYGTSSGGLVLATYPAAGAIPVDVVDGLFSVVIDFGTAAFAGEQRWLEIVVNGNTLSPRQELTVTPYALFGMDTQKIRGREVSTAAPAASQVLKWNGTLWAPAADVDTNTTYTAGTGLTLTGTTFALDLTYADGRYVNEGQTAGSDLSGTYPNPTVDGLQGRPVSSTAPTANQVLKWNGTAWAPAADVDTTYSASTGLTLAGTTFAFDQSYGDGRYVNEGQANSISNAMLQNGSVS